MKRLMPLSSTIVALVMAAAAAPAWLAAAAPQQPAQPQQVPPSPPPAAGPGTGQPATAGAPQQPGGPGGAGGVGGPGAPGQPAGRGRGGGGFRQPDPIDFQEHDGWTSLWDGRTLNGWAGDDLWKVEDDAIVIESTCEKPTGTVYLVWQGGEAANFELKLQMKGTGAINGGVQYRGWIAPPRGGGPGPGAAGGAGAPPPAGAVTTPTAADPARAGGPPAGSGAQAAQAGAPAGGQAPGGRAGGGRGPVTPCPSGAPRGTPPDAAAEAKWNMAGAQYDFDAPNQYTGQFYEQATGRGIVAWKGQVVRTEEGKSPRLLATLGDAAVINSYYKPNEWNELHIIAIGNQMTHILNGHVISVLFDDDATRLHTTGIIGLEVEATGKLFTKDIWLKRLP